MKFILRNRFLIIGLSLQSVGLTVSQYGHPLIGAAIIGLMTGVLAGFADD